jgi:hypothetical protein
MCNGTGEPGFPHLRCEGQSNAGIPIHGAALSASAPEGTTGGSGRMGAWKHRRPEALPVRYSAGQFFGRSSLACCSVDTETSEVSGAPPKTCFSSSLDRFQSASGHQRPPRSCLADFYTRAFSVVVPAPPPAPQPPQHHNTRTRPSSTVKITGIPSPPKTW